MDLQKLKGKVALITGASGGIGQALALRLAQDGIYLVLCGRNSEKLEQLRSQVEELGTEAYAYPCNLLEDGFAPSCIAAALERFGRLDILINNAGMALSKPMEETTAEEFDLLMGTNARAPYFLCQAALPALRKSDHGTIINIASVVAHNAYSLQSAYAASKHALLGFSKSLAKEVYQDDIRVHVISPGAVFTDMVRVARPDLTSEGMILAEDIAEVAAFFIEHRTNAVVDEISVRRAMKEPFL